MATQANPSIQAIDLLDKIEDLVKKCNHDPNNIQLAFDCATLYGEAGDYDNALKYYQRILSINPEHADACFNIGVSYTRLGQYEEAEQAYAQAIKHSPEYTDAAVNLASLLIYLGRQAEAEVILKKAIQDDPRNPSVYLCYASLLIDQNDLDRAEELLQVAIEHSPRLAGAHYLLGRISYLSKDYHTASLHFENCLKHDSFHSDAWQAIGDSYLKLERDNDGIDAFRKAIMCDEQNVEAWLRLSRYFLDKGIPEAEKCLAKVIELDKTNHDALEMLRQLYTRHSNYRKLRPCLVILLDDNPEQRELLAQLIDTDIALGSYESAIANLEKLAQINGLDERSTVLLAGLYLQTGSVITAYKTVVRFDTERSNTVRGQNPELSLEYKNLFWSIAQGLIYQKQLELGTEALLRLTEINTDNFSAWQSLGRLYIEQQEWEKAFDCLSQASATLRDDYLWITLSRGLIAANKPELALKAIRNLRLHAAFFPEIWEELLDIYGLAGAGEAFATELEEQILELQHNDLLWGLLAQIYSNMGKEDAARTVSSRIKKPQQVKRWLSQAAPNWNKELLFDLPQNVGEKEQLIKLEELRRSLKSNRHSSADWFKAGELLTEIGQLKDAYNCFMRYTRLEPDSAQGWYNLGYVSYKRQMLRYAVDYFRRALVVDEGFAAAWNWLGVTYYSLKDFSMALEAFQKCLAANPQHAKCWNNLGVLYLHRLNQPDKAKTAFQECAKHGGIVDTEENQLLYTDDPY